MKATHIGKTILVWNKLSDEEILRLIASLKQILNDYRNFTKLIDTDKPIPINLKDDNQYLCIIKKNSEIFLCATKNKNEYSYNTIINADFLFKSIDLLENCKCLLKQRINTTQIFSNTKWIELPSIKSFEEYLLTPNINPESFIRNLKNNTLSDMSKRFLEDVGISLQKSDFSKDLQNSIDDINSILEER